MLTVSLLRHVGKGHGSHAVLYSADKNLTPEPGLKLMTGRISYLQIRNSTKRVHREHGFFEEDHRYMYCSCGEIVVCLLGTNRQRKGVFIFHLTLINSYHLIKQNTHRRFKGFLSQEVSDLSSR